MEIVNVDRDGAAQFIDEVVELAYATGPSTVRATNYTGGVRPFGG